jgi:prepilin-type N-terminal cleavage/methylation domain-containing protein
MRKATIRSVSGGFTLIEVIIAMVLLAIASTVIITLQSTLLGAIRNAGENESALHAQQECVEEIMMIRQKWLFQDLTHSKLVDPDNNPTTPPPICDSLVRQFQNLGKDPSGILAVSVNLTNQDIDSCPEAVFCKTISIPAQGTNRIQLLIADFQL